MSETFWREAMEFGKYVGFPALFALAVLYLLYLALKLQSSSQAISAQQTEILGGLAVHVTEVAERTESHGQKLDQIHGLLARGVCQRRAGE
jgi:hypothetical protein